MGHWFKPQTQITEKQVKSGLNALLLDGMCSQVMGVFTGGAFLVAFALLIGASNKTIGLLAAVGPATQILQIPAIYLVDRLRLRKAMVCACCIIGRCFWLVAAAIPWFLPEAMRVPVLLFAIAIYFALGAVAGCAWNSWMRDFVPESIMGGYFAKRMAISTALGAVLSMAAGFGVDYFKTQLGPELMAYTILLAAGGVAGLVGCFFQMRIPEPVMAKVDDKGLLSVLAEPFRAGNFRHLLIFMGLWSFAINLAAPFFTVYLLQRIGLSMTWVIGLSVLSQLVNVIFFRIWGKLADRFSNKSVLTVSGPLFIVSIMIWPFTTMPERHMLTIPLLISIHVLAGISTAGVNLCAGNLALKAAP
ncbi:MAG: MFS transporter, partial [Phycisphaeraceae bacterium JB051]